ncbi:hypothetical protein [Priestia megaterium]|uniref:hypothetical protein n=1 Tax=Priestia megaterium TaxID=1404 RepID=UPI00211BF98B|nr:hypothetical protein [Priestia megaterium]MDH3157307.1 hypothetical protein [Priestia megaterium]MED4112288.1 hypothetical protein [Priestia megaterium]
MVGLCSWKCAVSGISIASVYSKQPSWQQECYLVTPGKVYYESCYQGYGEFAGMDIFCLMRESGAGKEDSEGVAAFKPKIVLAKYYSGQRYEELAESELCPYAGYFFEGWKEG